jgi:ABC-type dipeptide/oligopeptide/nickel transport system permease component
MNRRYLMTRLFQSVITIWAAITVTFGLIKAMPGGPVAYFRAQLANRGLDPSKAEAKVQSYLSYDPDAPLWRQYIDYAGGVAQGEFGNSILYSESVPELLLGALPWTVLVLGTAMLITTVLAVVIGALMAYWEGGRFDSVSTVVTMVFDSVPFYITALVLLLFFGYAIPLFPTQGTHSPDVEVGFSLVFIGSVAYHLALPVTASVIGSVGGTALSMRGNSISVLGSDFIRVGRLRGLSQRRLALNYVAHNAFLPMYTGLLISLGFLVGGSVILEQIFAYKGVGFYLFQAISARDFALLMGGFLLITTTFTIGVFLADVTYGLIDPRVDTSDRNRQSYGSARSVVDVLRNVFLGVERTVRGLAGGSSASLGEADRSAESVFDTRAETEYSNTDRLKLVWQDLRSSFVVLWSDWRARMGLYLLGGFLLLGVTTPLLVPKPEINQAPNLVPWFHDGWFGIGTVSLFGMRLPIVPELTHPLGTDSHGRDLLAMTLYSIEPIFKMIATGSLLAVGIGTVFGTVAGYMGGFVERTINTLTDIVMAIPGLPLMILLGVIFEPRNPYMIGFILGIDNWPGLARAVRSQVLTLRDSSHVEAMRSMGMSTPSIIYNNILPDIMSYVSINLAKSARGIIFSSVGLYFLGVLPFTTQNWGVILNQAYNWGALYTMSTIHWILVPVLTILLFTLSIILIAQGLDRVFNPRIRARHIDDDDEVSEDSYDDESPTSVAPTD